jgi:hypothetical protein
MRCAFLWQCWHDKRAPFKLYADEDIEEGAVEAIREYRRVNIKSAREAGNAGKEDSFQVAFAKREKRFLLTKNAKDFWPEREVPFHSTYGIIIVEGSEEGLDSYVTALRNVLDTVVPFEDSFIGSKVWVTPTRVTIKESRRWPSRDGEIQAGAQRNLQMDGRVISTSGWRSPPHSILNPKFLHKHYRASR